MTDLTERPSWEIAHVIVVQAEVPAACQANADQGWEPVAALPLMVRPAPVPMLGPDGVLRQTAPGEPVPGAMLIFKRPKAAGKLAGLIQAAR